MFASIQIHARKNDKSLDLFSFRIRNIYVD